MFNEYYILNRGKGKEWNEIFFFGTSQEIEREIERNRANLSEIESIKKN